jgi:uncharacterized protein YjbI with pentapeptide repeats
MDIPKEKRIIAPSDIPKEAVLKTCDFAGATFVGDAIFTEKTFDCFADFSNAEFQGEADFSKTVFLKGVSFQGAKFFCNGKNASFEEALFLPSENNIDFSNAQFGNPYHLELDGWRIGFQLEIEDNNKKKYHLTRSKKEKGKPTVTETLRDLKEEGLGDFLKSWNMDYHARAILQTFKIFCGNPNTVSFSRCQFGDMNFPELNKDEIKSIKTRINRRLDRHSNFTLLNKLRNSIQEFEAFYAKDNNNSIAEKQKKIATLFTPPKKKIEIRENPTHYSLLPRF